MRVDGALTLATVSQRWPELTVAAQSASEIDLSGLTDFDSAGLACLTALKREWATDQQSSHTPLKLRGASPKVLALASTYDVKALFDF